MNARVRAASSVATLSSRIGNFAAALADGHKFGFGPGVHNEPWTVDFHDACIHVYATALPWNYLVMVGSAYSRGVELMHGLPQPDEPHRAWTTIKDYMQAISTAIDRHAPAASVRACDAIIEDFEARPPAVLPYNVLSELVSEQGVADLWSASTVVLDYCHELEQPGLSDQELEWIRQIIAGERIQDIAEGCGYSRRSLHRALRDLWHRLGADNRAEAIAVAVRRGLV